MLIDKYYSSLITQFILGCSFFIISFLIIKDVFSGYDIGQYKYYIAALIIIDAAFLIYLTKFRTDPKKIAKSTEAIDFIKKPENTSTDLRTGTIQSVSLSSEINDYRVGHDLTLSDDEKESFFSNSDEKPAEDSDKKSDKKSDEMTSDASLSIEKS